MIKFSQSSVDKNFPNLNSLAMEIIFLALSNYLELFIEQSFASQLISLTSLANSASSLDNFMPDFLLHELNLFFHLDFLVLSSASELLTNTLHEIFSLTSFNIIIFESSASFFSLNLPFSIYLFQVLS